MSALQKGIGAAFHINAETKAFKDFFTSLHRDGIRTIDPNDAHVTIIDCAETQVSVFSERDQISLNRARSRASDYLSTLPYYELVLSPTEPPIQVFGRRIGLAIAQTDFMLGVRKYIGDIFKNEAGIGLSNRNYKPHISVGLKTRGVHSAVKKVKTQRVPRQLHVNGHDVSERVYVDDPSRFRSKQNYTNRHLRSVS